MALGEEGGWVVKLCGSDGQFVVHKLPLGEEWGVRVHTLWFWWSGYGSQIAFGWRKGCEGAHFVILMVSLWFTNCLWVKNGVWGCTLCGSDGQLIGHKLKYNFFDRNGNANRVVQHGMSRHRMTKMQKPACFDKLKAHKRLKSMLLLTQYKTIILSNEKYVLFSAFCVFWPCLKCWQLTFLHIKI